MQGKTRPKAGEARISGKRALTGPACKPRGRETPGAETGAQQERAQSAKNGEAKAGRGTQPSPGQAREPQPERQGSRRDKGESGASHQTGGPAEPTQAWQWGATRRKTRECSTLEDLKKERMGDTHQGMANNVPKPRIGTVERITAPGHMRRRKACHAGAKGARNQSACSGPRPERSQRRVTSRRMKSCRI